MVFAVALLLLPIVAACGRTSGASSTPSLATLWATRLSLKDVTPVTGDAKNWWDAAPTFDLRPLNSASRADAELGGLTIRFTHLGTAELLSLNYDVINSSSIAGDFMAANKLLDGNGVTGPKAGDQILYYNRKLAAGPTVYNNVAYVQLGATVITIIWSHVEGFASTNAVGKIASKAVSRLKDGLAGKVHPSPLGAADPLLLAPSGPQLTLLGAVTLPIEVLAQLVNPVSSPTALVDEFHTNGVSSFLFADYALNLDTRMEVVTAGINFTKFPTGGPDFIKGYFGAAVTSTGEAGGYDAAAGQYVYGFGGGSRAILVVCKSSVEGEEAARACEAPMALLVADWHPLLTPPGA